MLFNPINRYLAFFLIFLGGCATVPPDALVEGSGVIRGKEYVIHRVEAGDTLPRLADLYLKDRSKGWLIADFNNANEI